MFYDLRLGAQHGAKQPERKSSARQGKSVRMQWSVVTHKHTLLVAALQSCEEAKSEYNMGHMGGCQAPYLHGVP